MSHSDHEPYIADEVPLSNDIGVLREWLSREVKRIQNGFIGVDLSVESRFGDSVIGGLAVAKGSSAPDLETFRDNLALNAFAGSGTTEQVFFSVAIPVDIKNGTVPHFHLHWSHNTNTATYTPFTEKVVWQLEYSIAKGHNQEVYPAAVALTDVLTAGPQYFHHTSVHDSMPLSATFEPDSVVICRLFRDPAHTSDTFTNDVHLIQVGFHYEKGSHGNVETDPPFTGFD